MGLQIFGDVGCVQPRDTPWVCGLELRDPSSSWARATHARRHPCRQIGVRQLRALLSASAGAFGIFNDVPQQAPPPTTAG
eukprot:scaffold25009_cov128-Isochrysis_galbana.AAC.1